VADPKHILCECLPYDAWLNLADGTKQKIGKIVTNKMPALIKCKGPNGNTVEKIVGWQKGGICTDWIYITTEHGSNNKVSIIVTPDHKIYTRRGILEAKKLLLQDDIEFDEPHCTTDRIEALYGMLAGDASIIKGKRIKNPRISFVHSIKQRDYFSYKQSIFESWKNNNKQYRKDDTIYARKYPALHYVSKCSHQFSKIWDIVRINGKKQLTPQWIDQMTWRSLAFWYMDDGHLGYTRVSKEPRAYITSEWTKTCPELLQRLFNKFNLSPTLDGKPRSLSIRFNTDSDLFFKGIALYVPENMQRKLPVEYRGRYLDSFMDIPSTTFVKITNIFHKSREHYPNRHKYSIMVEPSHNYFYNRHLVKNCDMNQHELRVMAEIAGDTVMKKALKGDIHTATASIVFGIPPEEVTNEQRREAKTINFGIIYGLTPYGLSQQLEIPESQAELWIYRFFEKYFMTKKYMDTTSLFCRRHGYVESLSGRRRYFPSYEEFDIKKIKEAINFPVQSTASDILLYNAIGVDRLLRGRKSFLVLEVHDSLLLNIHRSEISLIDEIRDLMCTYSKQFMPFESELKVDVKIGENWLEMEDYK